MRALDSAGTPGPWSLKRTTAYRMPTCTDWPTSTASRKCRSDCSVAGMRPSESPPMEAMTSPIDTSTGESAGVYRWMLPTMFVTT